MKPAVKTTLTRERVVLGITKAANLPGRNWQRDFAVPTQRGILVPTGIS